MEGLGRILRAAAAAAFVVGTALLFLNPPSLAGAENLLLIALGAIVLVFATAWLTVVLSGPQAMSEPEFDRVVIRSEELARRPALAEEATEFEVLVAEAIDRLPDEFRRLLEDVPVVVSRRGRAEHAYGHYFGDTLARGHYEDRIVLYQDTLERDFGHDLDLLARQVERTLRHEIAHHLGWDESGVSSLGL